MIMGTCLYMLGLILMIKFRKQDSSRGTIIATQVFLGVGGSLTHVPAQLGVQASASHSEVAAATALFLTFLEIGGAVGSAISGAIWSSNIPLKLREYLPEETRDQASEIFGNISLASNGWPMGSPTRLAINQAYQETMTKILTVAVCAALPCIILALLMKDYKLDEIDQGVTGVVIGGGASSSARRKSVVGNNEDNEEEEDIEASSSQPLVRTSLSRDGIYDDPEDERIDSQTQLLGNRDRS